jgi:hypothetical protein
MPSPKKNVSQSPLTPEDQLDFIKIVYGDICESSRYYDSHIWQIPSVTIAVNAFLVGQAFSASMVEPSSSGVAWVRMLVVLSASFFTLVLLIALVKHQLHKGAQDKNIKKIEKYMNLPDELHYRYDLSKELEKVEPKPSFLERLFAPLRAHTWLMAVMVVTLVADLAIFVGIALGWW